MHFAISKELNIGLIESTNSGLESLILELNETIIDSNLEDIDGMEAMSSISSSIAEAGLTFIGLEADDEATKGSKVKAFMDKIKGIWQRFVSYISLFLDGYYRKNRAIIKHLVSANEALEAALDLPGIDSKRVSLKDVPEIAFEDIYEGSIINVIGRFLGASKLFHYTKVAAKKSKDQSDQEFIDDMYNQIDAIRASVDEAAKLDKNDKLGLTEYESDLHTLREDTLKNETKIRDGAKDALINSFKKISEACNNKDNLGVTPTELEGNAKSFITKFKTFNDTIISKLGETSDNYERVSYGAQYKSNDTPEELAEYCKKVLEFSKDVFIEYKKTYKNCAVAYFKFIKNLYKAEMSALKQISSKKSSINEKE